MYKVLLVDDEILIRERISQRIPWESLGYELRGTCENGKEAIEFMEKQPVDLVLTDICMPYVDGLELAKYLYENEKRTKVVIITGYDEFEYAKKAVEYRVLSYVLKPVTAVELIEKLEEAKKTLDSEEANLQVRTYYEGSFPLLKNQFLLQLSKGKFQEEEIEEKLKEFHIDFQGECYCTALLYPRVGLEKRELAQMSSLINREAGEDVLAFEGDDNNIILYVKKKNSSQLKKDMSHICEAAAKSSERELNIQVFSLIGTCVFHLGGMGFSYEKAMELKEYLYLERDKGIYEWDKYQKYKLSAQGMICENDREKRIVLAVRSNLSEEVMKEVCGIREECVERWIAKNKVVVLYQSLILAVMNFFERLNIVDDAFFLKEQEIISGLFGCTYISEMEKKVLEFFEMAVDMMNSNRGNYGDHQAMAALEYINSHYADCDLSLQEICEKLAISVSYFSSAFKNYTGMTFVEALTKRRMEKAIELLENTSLKTYEIAEKCGYNDANYFSAIFKRTTKMTPREYARTLISRKGTYEKQNRI
ncbi:response regulator transcription factor [Lacrimispora algidixylanolytica]|uniref:Stage 0 sporulation protein A homolog n=1 Tax=Lacrimispora algidixylanolytica TaxID=94868 RepID=A0A419TBZ7_9FIRM|nr:response regulator [Lacrimispora algidixylanolytica]RKD34998.1 hypothetical protein BET01_01195 [Lacrimispora algidixylanolytica]